MIITSIVQHSLAFDCGDFRKLAIYHRDRIEQESKKNDVSEYIKNFQEWAETCSVPLNSLDLSSTTLTAWKNIGLENAMQNARTRIIEDSDFKDVQEDLDEYQMLAAKANRDPRKIQKYLNSFSKYFENGKNSRTREEKECQPVDLRGPNLGEVRDQDSIGWCYAFTAADLLSFKIGKKISAADMAMKYNTGYIDTLRKALGAGEGDIEGGRIEGAISKIVKTGVCLEKNLKSEVNGPADLLETLNEINKFKKNDGSVKSSCYLAAKSVFPNLKASTIQEIVELSTRRELLSKLSDRACEPRSKLGDLKIESSLAAFKGGKIDVFKEIDKQLSEKNIVGVVLSGSLLMDKNDSKIFGGHAVVAVGRRFNRKTGSCDYLLRNSWGRGCNIYDPSYDCEEGNIWVPKAVLMRGSKLGVTYVK